MKLELKFLALLTGTIGLSACGFNNPAGYLPGPQPSGVVFFPHQGNDESWQSAPQTGNHQQSGIRSESVQNSWHPPHETQKKVVVPETYHMNNSTTTQATTPEPHKNRDRRWVEIQNPQGYTIEVADGDRASDVAGKLYRTPSAERKAEVNYQQNGATHYKGLYGSYSSYEAAQNALNALPEDVKSGARIKNWSNVQSNLGTE